MTMTDKLKRLDRALLELLTGIAVFGIVSQLAGLLFPIDRVKYAVGLWGGILLAFFSAIHMWRSLNKAFMCDEKSAARLLAGGYIIRYLIVAVFLVLIFYTDTGYPLAGFLGVMGLKAAAYLQPLTHKFYNWVFQETDPVPQPLAEEEDTGFEGMKE